MTSYLSTPELYSREAIRHSKRIANPGCYATNTQLLLAPLLPHLSSSPTVFGISGYSGAGTKSGSEPKIPPESLRGGVRPYSLTDHIHEREAGVHLAELGVGIKDFQVAFVPSVAPWFQGIISTASVPLKDNFSASELIKLYEDMYGGEKLIKVQREVPEVADISGKHGWTVGGFQVHSSGRRAVIVVSCAPPPSFYVVHSLVCSRGRPLIVTLPKDDRTPAVLNDCFPNRFLLLTPPPSFSNL